MTEPGQEDPEHVGAALEPVTKAINPPLVAVFPKHRPGDLGMPAAC